MGHFSATTDATASIDSNATAPSTKQPMRTKEFSDNEFSDDDDDDSEMEDKFTDNDLITLKDQEPDRFYKYKYKRKYLKKLEMILRGMVKYNRMRKKLLKRNQRDELLRKRARQEGGVKYVLVEPPEGPRIELEDDPQIKPIYVTVPQEQQLFQTPRRHRGRKRPMIIRGILATNPLNF